MSKRSVGLIVLTTFEGAKVALLQRRGELKVEDGELKHESWPGACQVICHGGLEEGETPLVGLQREVLEELSPAFEDFVFGKPKLDLIPVSHIPDNGKGEEIWTYKVMIKPEDVALIRLSTESGGLVMVDKEEASRIQSLKEGFLKSTGVIDRRTIAMFPDERDAVLAALSDT
jgi:hypothetical protein